MEQTNLSNASTSNSRSSSIADIQSTNPRTAALFIDASQEVSSLADNSNGNEPPRAGQDNGQTFSYQDDLWDSVDAIQNYQKRGVQMLQGLMHFCKNYQKVLNNFGHGLQKCGQQFEKEMLSNNNFDTSAIAVSSIKQGIEEVVKGLGDKINMVHGDLIEPIELYLKHYNVTSTDQIMQCKNHWTDQEEAEKKVSQARDKYYKLMQEVEYCEINIEQALLEHEKGEISIEQVQKITNQTLNIKYKAELSSQEYKKEVEKYNVKLLQFKDEYKPLLQALQQGEEARINFMKYNLEKIMKHFSGFGKDIMNHCAEMSTSINMVNSETDLKIFIDENKSNQDFLDKVEFKPYEQSQNIREQKHLLMNQLNEQKERNQHLGGSFEQVDPSNKMDEQILVQCYSHLMRGEDISLDQKNLIIQSMHEDRMRDIVAEYLKLITSPKVIENGEALKTLGELIKYLLTAFVHEKDENYKIIYSILHCSQLVFHITENPDQTKKKVFLTQYLNDHGIWQEQQMWKLTIQKVINLKFHEAIQATMSSKNNQNASYLSQAASGLIGMSFGRLRGMWGNQGQDQNQLQDNKDGQKGTQDKKSEPMRIQKSLAQNIIFNILSKFIFHFVNFQLSFESSKELVLIFCKKYELDSARTHLLLSELESIQKKSRFVLNEKEKLRLVREKNRKQIQKFGDSYTLILALSIRFINGDGTLVKLLVLDKFTHEHMATRIYKQALMYSELQRLSAKRILIWKCILNMNKGDRDYEAFKVKAQGSSNMDEMINMDVQRSFTKHKEMDPMVLTNILKTYAFFNPEVEYCQGMNFLAGFLYIVFQDEKLAFMSLHAVIEQYQMTELLNSELTKLKLFFYQFDRLLSYQLPRLHSHFKDETINASYYSSPWFITIFTNALQNQDSDIINERLLQFWDYFLTCGWKAIFNTGLYILQENESDLLQMDFEEILNYLLEKPKQLLVEHNSQILQNAAPGEGNQPALQNHELVLYHEMKRKIREKGKVNLNFLLERFQGEFDESLTTAFQFNPGSPNNPAKK